MQNRGFLVTAALGAVAVVILWFAFSPPDEGGAARPSRGVAAAADPAEPGAELPAGWPGTRTPGAAAPTAAPGEVAPDPEALRRAADPELPREPEQGGLAFGRSICDKMAECSCQGRHPSTCAHDWSWVAASDWPEVKCAMDLSCADVCRHHQHPQDVACLVGIDKVHEERLGAAPWRDNRGSAIPGIVTGNQVELEPAPEKAP